MTATSILPSVKISGSGGSRSPGPRISEPLASDDAGSENGRPTTSGNGKGLKKKAGFSWGADDGRS